MNLLFDFKVDKTTATIYITREFAADVDLVWDAFTKAEILDQWMSPKPYRLRTKEIDRTRIIHVAGKKQGVACIPQSDGVRCVAGG